MKMRSGRKTRRAHTADPFPAGDAVTDSDVEGMHVSVERLPAVPVVDHHG